MRNYIAKIYLSGFPKNMTTGKTAEAVFEYWFKQNYQGENVFKQFADMDYKGIDFADEKGGTYQIKGTKGRTFTFNCDLENLREHLKAFKYVCVQVTKKAAYIESIYSAEEILEIAKPSFKYNRSCFIWAKDLKQYIIEI